MTRICSGSAFSVKSALFPFSFEDERGGKEGSTRVTPPLRFPQKITIKRWKTLRVYTPFNGEFFPPFLPSVTSHTKKINFFLKDCAFCGTRYVPLKLCVCRFCCGTGNFPTQRREDRAKGKKKSLHVSV